jgi:hypothetical protein
MTRIMNELVREVRFGDLHKGEDEILIRLWSDVREDNGERMWVDFAIYEVIGNDHDGPNKKGRKFYQQKGASVSPMPVYDPEEAESLVEGFVKWDGCTQFTADIHVDSRDHLDIILSSIGRARQEAADVMAGCWLDKGEYQ